MNKYIIGGALFLVVVGGVLWWRMQPATAPFMNVIEKDTVLQGNYIVPKESTLVVRHGATLTVKKNLTVDGSIICEQGPVSLVVEGNTTLNGSLICDISSEGNNNVHSAIRVVAQGAFTMGEQALVEANGDIRVTDDPAQIATTFSWDVVRAVHAQDIRTIGAGLGGTVRVKPLVQGQSPLVMFYFSKGRELIIPNFTLEGASGAPGTDDFNKSCTARGGKGGDASRFMIIAPAIRVIGVINANLGDGGKGGMAATPGSCDPGIAVGGAGGLPGSIALQADMLSMKGTGVLNVNPGKGGTGGEAWARGKQGPPTAKGGDAEARGGDASASFQPLRILGISKDMKISLATIFGGDGGKALAEPGKGGDGIPCKANAGPGGRGFAQGGAGGGAQYVLTDAIPGIGITRFEEKGGKGGNADVAGAAGGFGTHCDEIDGKGGDGGKGGNATAVAGAGGKGKDSNGERGSTNNPGGNGGDGGNACHPGVRAIGGSGKPDGVTGKDGVKKPELCPKPQIPENPPKKKIIIETPPPKPPVQTIPTGGSSGSGGGGGTTVPPDQGKADKGIYEYVQSTATLNVILAGVVANLQINGVQIDPQEQNPPLPAINSVSMGINGTPMERFTSSATNWGGDNVRGLFSGPVELDAQKQSIFALSFGQNILDTLPSVLTVKLLRDGQVVKTLTIPVTITVQ